MTPAQLAERKDEFHNALRRLLFDYLETNADADDAHDIMEAQLSALETWKANAKEPT